MADLRTLLENYAAKKSEQAAVGSEIAVLDFELNRQAALAAGDMDPTYLTQDEIDGLLRERLAGEGVVTNG